MSGQQIKAAFNKSVILALVGPTAVGKSALAQSLAQFLGARILNCDSVQVYRKFEIGCAKPGVQARQQAVHLGLDLVDANQPFDAADYVRYAQEHLQQARQQQVPVIICGGTGLYLRALRFGLPDLPKPCAKLRARLLAQEQHTPGSLLQQLCALDERAAQHIDCANARRVLRALEVYLMTGKSIVWHWQQQPKRPVLPIKPVLLFREQAQLRQRIAKRTAQMLRAGLLQEVRTLNAQGAAWHSKPMRSVGYRQVADYLTAGASACIGQRPDLQDLCQQINARTWEYAKRQLTWFAKEPGICAIKLEQDAFEADRLWGRLAKIVRAAVE